MSWAPLLVFIQETLRCRVISQLLQSKTQCSRPGMAIGFARETSHHILHRSGSVSFSSQRGCTRELPERHVRIYSRQLGTLKVAVYLVRFPKQNCVLWVPFLHSRANAAAQGSYRNDMLDFTPGNSEPLRWRFIWYVSKAKLCVVGSFIGFYTGNLKVSGYFSTFTKQNTMFSARHGDRLRARNISSYTPSKRLCIILEPTWLHKGVTGTTC